MIGDGESVAGIAKLTYGRFRVYFDKDTGIQCVAVETTSGTMRMTFEYWRTWAKERGKKLGMKRISEVSSDKVFKASKGATKDAFSFYFSNQPKKG